MDTVLLPVLRGGLFFSVPVN